MPIQPKGNNRDFLVINIVPGPFTLLAAACIVLRFIHHHRKRIIWWDDWAILAAFVTGAGAYISGLLCTLAGYRIDEYTISQLNTCAKTGLAGEVLYTVSVAFSKISVLLFYKRIFDVDTQFFLFTRIMTILVIEACFTYTFGLIFTTIPAKAQWDVNIIHTSINAVALYMAMGTINILIDVVIIALVQRKVWKLQMAYRRKLVISFLFLLAISSVAFGILRVVYTGTMNPDNATYTLTLAWLWANLELFLYIICACLPIVYNFYRSKFPSHSKNDSWKTNEMYYPQVMHGSNPLKEKRSKYYELDEETCASDNSIAYGARNEDLRKTQSTEPLVRPERALHRDEIYGRLSILEKDYAAEQRYIGIGTV
ncbi:hypothetical protein F5Y00DRAFT_258422 [Daldinia vernicosa]|uniref:uncharacterized protein n=1 Tax=Daldinia vernicosa TaxID=114800 RepID=UPI00200726F4|nr:uncharacterized protein F5Y00DRAFT_258422 [Daldinia vernicosa]KAI0852576.1 hypothetical protein F5Y00DRAFT_258422 [Daldinia vernicosa]